MDHIIPEPRGAQPVVSDFAAELRALHQRYRRQDLRRWVSFWWPRAVLIVLGGCLGALLGVVGVYLPLVAIGVVLAPIFVVLLVKHLGLGWMVLGICASPLVPPVFSVKSLTFFPVEFGVALLLIAVGVRAVLHVRRFVLPSFWVIWPQLGLISLAILSEILIQVTWVPQVPHKINSLPVIYSELVGIVIYTVPLVTIVATTTVLTGHDRWIPRVMDAFLLLGVVQAIIICIEFKRIGADVYAFRYTEPYILYMQLGAIAQFLVVAAVIAYARALLSARWRGRLAYGALTLLYLAAIGISLENARWVAVAAALIVMTFAFSRRLFALFCVLGLPLIPVALDIVQKIQDVKGGRDSVRFKVWADMIRIWWKHPVLGVGPGNVWPFDQVFTQLPLKDRNLANTGLGVAHDGMLQVLAEVGPLGVVFYFSVVAVIALAAWRLYRRSDGPHARADRILALACLGLVIGCLAGDFASGDFFRPPTQIGGFNDISRTTANWMLFGALLYKDQLWRLGKRLERVAEIARVPVESLRRAAQ